MRKITIALAMSLLLASAAASAKDMRGRFGLGYDQSLGGASGLALTYWVTHALGIDLIMGLDLVSPDEGDNQVAFNTAFGVRYNIARARDVNLGIGLRGSMGFLNKAATGGDSIFQFNLDIPLIVEYFFSKHFAISLATGITMQIVPEDGNALTAQNTLLGTTRDTFSVSFFNGGFFGTAGFRFYF